MKFLMQLAAFCGVVWLLRDFFKPGAKWWQLPFAVLAAAATAWVAVQRTAPSTAA